MDLACRDPGNSSAVSGVRDGEAADDFVNPFIRDVLAPIEPEVEAWARALCIAFGAKPDKLIGMPEAPRWRSWVGYAELSMKAARALGCTAPQTARDKSREDI